jgi:hypothetical protein
VIRELTSSRSIGRNSLARVGNRPAAGQPRVVRIRARRLGRVRLPRQQRRPGARCRQTGRVRRPRRQCRLGGRRGRARRRRRGAAGRVDLAAGGLDAVPGAAGARVRVAAAGRVVGDADRLDVHAVGPGAVVGRAAGPGDGAGAVGRVTAGPDAELDLHGRLRVLVGLGGGGGQHADRLAVDLPDDLVGGPFDGVRAVRGLGVGGGHPGGPVVGARDALAEVVCLNLLRLRAEPLPVDLVEVVADEDELLPSAESRRSFSFTYAADDSDAGSGLEDHVDTAKHDVPRGNELRGIARAGHGKR